MTSILPDAKRSSIPASGSFFDPAGCGECRLCSNQLPLFDKENPFPDVLWLGLSAVRIVDVSSSRPLGSDTQTGGVIDTVESRLPNVSFRRTNLVRCLPLDEKGKIRYPTRDEIESCFGHLLKEIDETRPSTIIMLGGKVFDFVRRKLGEGERIAEKKGLVCGVERIDGRLWVEAYHPSYILVYKRRFLAEYIQGISSVVSKR